MTLNVSVTVDSETTITGFGQLDGKGRKLGLSVRKSTLAVQYGPVAHVSWSRALPSGRLVECADLYTEGELAYSPAGAGGFGRQVGLYYTASCHATRAGQTFGACQPERLFDSAAERDAYVAKRLADSRKRAPKAATSGRSARTTG